MLYGSSFIGSQLVHYCAEKILAVFRNIMTELPTHDETETGRGVETVLGEANETCDKENPFYYKQFRENEDVLSRWSDGLLYLGTIVKVDAENEKCLVKFEDDSEYWTLFKDLQKEVAQESDIVCSFCENGVSEPPNEIVLCDHCNFGFHQLCHIPEIPCSVLQPDIPWVCRQCTEVMVTKKGKVKKNNSAFGVKYPKSFPYDLNVLKWDNRHKTNAQQCYCYCGGPGEWFRKMLQCWKCKQWFHEACVQCLEKPLLFGDRYYCFVCSVCNSGMECIYRLEIKWVDIIHLVIYNLTMKYNKKYYEFEEHIMSFVNEIWDLLQLKEPVASYTEDERKEHGLAALSTNKTRFQCGRELKKKHTIWGLRLRIPPPPPKICNPLELNLEWLSQPKIKTEPCTISKTKNENAIKGIKIEDKNGCVNNEHPIQKIRKRRREADLLLESAVSAPMPKRERVLLPRETMRQVRLAVNNGGSNSISNKKNVKKKKKANGSVRAPKVERPLQELPPVAMKTNKYLTSNNRATKGYSCGFNSSHLPFRSSTDEDTSSRGTLDSFIPPPLNFEGRNHPFRDLNLLPFSRHFVQLSKRKLNQDDVRLSKNGIVRVKKYRRRQLITHGDHIAEDPSLCEESYSGFSNFSEGSFETNSDYEGTCSSTLTMERLHSPGISLDDLKSSVHSYFGAATRIASGEKFTVLARRVTPEAKVQYLIEWEGLTA